MKSIQKPVLNESYSVSARITINDSRDAVWTLLRDFSNVQRWAPSVKSSHALGKAELGVGAGRHCVLDGFGEIEETITQWHEGHGFVYDVTPLGPLAKSYSRWWLTDAGDGKTQLEVELSYNLRYGWFGRALHALVMRSKLEASLPETLNAVKQEVEHGEYFGTLFEAVAT